jgi:hypothetical protein
MSKAMETYAAEKAKKGKPAIAGVTIRKAKNGFIVTVDNDDYSSPGRSNQAVYQDISGVLKCVKEKLGGS